jgi:fibronectin-binding autotransporter adhesin
MYLPALLIFVASLAVPSLVLATDYSWSGGSGTAWSTKQNWTGNTLPGGTDNAVFSSTFSNQPTLGTTAANVGGIWMKTGVGQNVTIGGTGTLTLGGNTINGTSGLGIRVDNTSAYTLTINAPIALGASQTWTNNSGNLLTVAAVSLIGYGLTINGSGPTTISGPISSVSAGNALTKSGSGKLTLSGTNTFNGQLTVQSGTLSVNTINNASTSGVLGNSALAVSLGALGSTGTLEFSGATTSSTKSFSLATGGIGAFQIDNASTILTLSGVISGSGALQKTAGGTLELTGTNSYAGGTTINGGTVAINNSSSLGASTGGLTINSGTLEVTTGFSSSRTLSLGTPASTLQIDVGQTFNITGVVGGTGTLNKTGSGTLVLSAANLYTGGTTISGGTLAINSASSLGTSIGGLTINAGTLEVSSGFSATTAIALGNSTSTLQIDGGQIFSVATVVSGNGTLNKTGSGTLVLATANSYSGGTVLNGGTLSIIAGALGSGALTINAGTLELAGSLTAAPTLTLSSSSSAIQVDNGFTYSLNSAITGTGGLNVTGGGTLALGGANTFSGGTTVTAGTLQLNASERLLNTAPLTVNGGTLNLQSFNETVGALTLSSGTITGSGTLTASSITLQAGSISAILAGTTLTKSTAGTMTLSAANVFTGATAVNAGVLQVIANDALGSVGAGTSVANGAELRLNNVNYSTAESVSINGSGISNGGALRNVGTSTFAGQVTAATDATINAGGGTLNLTGGLVKNGTTLTLTGGGHVNVGGIGISGSLLHSDLVVDGTTVTLSAASSYNGPTTVQNSGTLQLGASNVLPSSPQTALTINTSSAFDLASYSDAVASLAGDSTGIVKNSVAASTSTLTVNPSNSTSTTFAGVITGTNSGAQGNVSLVKSGAGTFVLSGANTFTGDTTVNGGTLVLAANSGNALSSMNITVNAGATLQLGGSNQINNSATLTLAGGTFAKGNYNEGNESSNGVGVLSLGAAGSHIDFGTGTVGILTLASFIPNGQSLMIDNWTGTANAAGGSTTDRLIFAADQTTNLSYFNFAGYYGATEFPLGNNYFEVVPISAVPEPGTYAFGLFAIAGVAVHTICARRRR